MGKVKKVHMTTENSRGEFTFCSQQQTPWGTPDSPHVWTDDQSEVTCKSCLAKLMTERDRNALRLGKLANKAIKSKPQKKVVENE